MQQLNYRHLLYFHTVAETGSIVAAARELEVKPQTISGQLKVLESDIGRSLFVKSGRGLEISDAGKAIKAYTDGIFTLGRKLAEYIGEEQTAETG